MPRPKEYDLHLPFEIWGIWVEAREKGGFPHQNRTYFVKKDNGDDLMIYSSPCASKPAISNAAHMTFLSVENYLRSEGPFAYSLCRIAYVQHAEWVEKDDEEYRRQHVRHFVRKLYRVGGWRDTAILKIVRGYYKRDKEANLDHEVV